jgi:hypothetical protein
MSEKLPKIPLNPPLEERYFFEPLQKPKEGRTPDEAFTKISGIPHSCLISSKANNPFSQNKEINITINLLPFQLL